MGGYIINFTVYTMAMVGLIFFALFAYKKFNVFSTQSKRNDFLEIEESMNIAPRKMLHVIRAGNERFLIASDVDKTSLIAKLDDGKKIRTDRTSCDEELPVIVEFPQNGNTTVIKEMLNKMNRI